MSKSEVKTHDYAPVCLNSLLFKTEMDLAKISETLGHESGAAIWKQKAEVRRAAPSTIFFGMKPRASNYLPPGCQKSCVALDAAEKYNPPKRVPMLFTPRSTVEAWRWSPAFLLTLWIALALNGCSGNTCFVSNPPNGIIGIAVSNPSTPCVVPRVFAAIRVTAYVTRVCEACSSSNQVRSLLLSINGIDLRAKVNNAGETPDWQALLPELERPRQIDLASGLSGHSITRVALGKSTTVPAGTYDLVRLRLAIDQPDASNSLAAQNACATGGHNCVLMEDGRVESLQFEEGAPELLIPLKASTDVVPGSDNELLLDLTPIWSVFHTADQAIALFPSLTGSAKLERTAS